MAEVNIEKLKKGCFEKGDDYGSEEETGREAVDIADLPDDADRALSMVATRLAKVMSIEHAVNQLIQEATDFDHLATIFSGQSTFLCSQRFRRC